MASVLLFLTFILPFAFCSSRASLGIFHFYSAFLMLLANAFAIFSFKLALSMLFNTLLPYCFAAFTLANVSIYLAFNSKFDILAGIVLLVTFS